MNSLQNLCYYIETSDIHEGEDNERIHLYYYNHPENYKEFSLEHVREILDNLHETLPKLTLDKTNGVFRLGGHMEDFGTEYEKGENCCVCLEKTTTETQCRHHLCIECWSKIKPIGYNKHCPLCRSNHICVYNPEDDEVVE